MLGGCFTEGLALEREPVSVMHQPIEDGLGEAREMVERPISSAELTNSVNASELQTAALSPFRNCKQASGFTLTYKVSL